MTDISAMGPKELKDNGMFCTDLLNLQRPFLIIRMQLQVTEINNVTKLTQIDRTVPFRNDGK